MPSMTNMLPATLDNNFVFTLSENFLPKYIVARLTADNAINAPKKSKYLLKFIVNKLVVSWDLSPISEINMNAKLVINGWLNFLIWESSHIFWLNVNTPNVKNKIPAIKFNIVFGRNEEIILPKKTAIAVVRAKASIIPIIKYVAWFFLDERANIANCVLSPSSESAIIEKGIRKSLMFILQKKI